MGTRTGPARLKQFGPSPTRIRPGPVDTSTVYVYVYIVYVYTYTYTYTLIFRENQWNFKIYNLFLIILTLWPLPLVLNQ